MISALKEGSVDEVIEMEVQFLEVTEGRFCHWLWRELERTRRESHRVKGRYGWDSRVFGPGRSKGLCRKGDVETRGVRTWETNLTGSKK